MNAYPFITGKEDISWSEMTAAQKAAKQVELDNRLAVFEVPGKAIGIVIGVAVFIWIVIVALGLGVIVDILALPAVAIGAWWYITKLLFAVHIMRDGLIIQEGYITPVKPFVDHDDHCYDWNEIEIIDFRPDIPTIKTTTRGPIPFSETNPRYVPYAEIYESLYINQQRGNIPREVVLFQKTAAAARSRFGEKVRNGLFYLAILFAVFIGYPLYVGDGSLFNSVAPTLAEIMPDAVGQAIATHPEWQLETKLKLRGTALAARVTPSSLFTFFQPDNSHNVLGYAVIFWIMKFQNRDQQVSMIASYFIPQIVKAKYL